MIDNCNYAHNLSSSEINASEKRSEECQNSMVKQKHTLKENKKRSEEF